jgi:hypothetical protein
MPLNLLALRNHGAFRVRHLRCSRVRPVLTLFFFLTAAMSRCTTCSARAFTCCPPLTVQMPFTKLTCSPHATHSAIRRVLSGGGDVLVRSPTCWNCPSEMATPTSHRPFTFSYATGGSSPSYSFRYCKPSINISTDDEHHRTCNVCAGTHVHEGPGGDALAVEVDLEGLAGEARRTARHVIRALRQQRHGVVIQAVNQQIPSCLSPPSVRATIHARLMPGPGHLEPRQVGLEGDTRELGILARELRHHRLLPASRSSPPTSTAA